MNAGADVEPCDSSNRFDEDEVKRALAILGLSGSPSDIEIKAAYRVKAFKCHLDKLPNHLKTWGTEEMIKVNKAYEVLMKKGHSITSFRSSSPLASSF